MKVEMTPLGVILSASLVQRLFTATSGRLGEWLELGGSSGEQSGSSAGVASVGTQAASGQRRLLLKVEELPPD